MNHRDFTEQLGPWLDGELTADAAALMTSHLKDCVTCVKTHASALAVREAVGAHARPFLASDTLRTRVRQDLRAEAGATPRGLGHAWTGLAAAATLALVAGGTWQIATTTAAREQLTRDLVTSHVRSLIGNHVTDVTSTDQHTVKPWFNGKLDYSPPVYDFAGRGYPLVGGRLDYVGGRQVAALVYQRRQHVINVYLWPNGRATTGGPPTDTQQGYHLIRWTAPEFSYGVVSDLGLGELTEFTHLLQQADSAVR